MMVSVIIPLYNVEKYIIQCLDSFEKQVYENFELVIVDDGSTDNSVVAVEVYTKNSNMKIRLINQVNAGVSAARNTGLDNAIGDYVCFVDADDMVGYDYLSKMVDIATSSGCEIVICGFNSVPESWNIDTYIPEMYPVKIMNSYETLRKFLYHDIVTAGVCSLLVKREIFDNSALRFARSYHYCEDIEMVWKIIANSKLIAFDRSHLYLYRVRNGSAMSFVDDRRIDGMRLMLGLENYFKELRPDFSVEFNRYATARWVWATLWQIAVANNNYELFLASAYKVSARNYMRKLITYRKPLVYISATLYCLSPRLYFSIANIYGRKRLNNRKVYS